MDILIKNVDVLSTDHAIGITVLPEGFAIVEEWEQCLPIKTMKCNISFLPPHGRLIDADNLKSSISERIIEQIEVMKKHDDEYYIPTAMQMGVNACLYELKMAPTVIEAEENEND